MKQSKVRRAKETQPRPRRRQPVSLPDEQLRVTLYSVGDAVIVTDTQGRVTMLNPVAEALTGWNEADALGKPLAQIFHIINEETRTVVENPVARVLREGVVIGLANHTLLIARDGREIPIADSGAPVRDARGKIVGVVLVFRDQTKERQAQRLVRQARDFAESIVATVREPLVVLDANLRVISANHAFYRTFQVTPAETDGHPIYELGNRQWDIPQLRALLENILPQNSHFDDFVVEHEFERIGKRTMLLNARRIRHDPNQTQMILLAIEDISDRQRAEDALRASEERYRTFIQQANDYIFTLNANGQITSANQIMCQDLGYTETELLGKSALELVIPQKREGAAQALQRIWSGESVDQFEVPIQTRDGKTIFVQIRGRSIDKDDQFVETLHIARNITDRKRAEDALRASEERYRLISEMISDYVYAFRVDADGTLHGEWITDSFLHVFGYTLHEVDARGWQSMVHPDDLSIALRHVQRVLSGKLDVCEVRFMTRAGEARWLRDYAIPIWDAEQNRVTRIYGAAQDITDRKRAEKALQESEEKFRTLFNSANDAIFTMNRTIFLDCNATVEKIFRCSKDQIIGRSPVDFSPEYQPDGRLSSESAAEKIEAAFAGKPQFFEWLHTHLDGTPFHAEVSLNRVFIGGEFILQAIVRDITARKHHERQLEAQAMLARALGESLDLQPLLERLLEAARHAIPAAEKGSVLLLEADGRLRIRALNGYSDPRLKDFTFASDSGYSASAARERRPLLIPDARADDSIRYDGEIEEARQIHSAIAAPLLIQERVIGVISLDSTRKDAFTQEDLDHLVSFAASTALIIENARLFEVERRQRQMAEQLSRALEAGTSLTSLLDSNLVLERLLESVEQVIPFDGGNIMLISEESGKVRVARLRGYRHLDERARQIVQNLSFDLAATENLRWLYEHKQPLVIPDISKYSDWISVEAFPVRSWIGAPILINNQVTAFFSLDSLTPNFFTEEHALLLQAFAGQASLALQNARLFEETRRRADELEALYESAQALAGKTSLEEALQAITQSTSRLFGATGAGLYLYDPLSQTLEVKLATHATIPLGTRLMLGEGLAGKVAQSRRVMRIDDYMRWEGRSPKYNGIPVRATMAAPLVYQDKLLGVLIVHEIGESERKFTEADERLLSLFAVQAAAAIQNARLFEDLRIRLTELETLHTIASLCIQATDEDSLIEQITDVLSNNLYPDSIGFLLMNAEGTHLLPHPSHRGITIENSPARIPLNAGIAGRVAASGKPYRTGDVRLEDAYIEINPATRSELCVPLIVGGRVLGVINAESHKLNTFSETDEHLLTTAASQVATALERLRLLNETRQRLAELEMLQTVSAALRQAHTLEEMIPLFVRYAIQAVQAQVGTIYLREDASGDWVSYGWVNAQGEWVTSSELRHRPGEGVTGKVGASGEIYITPDWLTDPLTRVHADEARLLSTMHSGISLPLRAEQHTIGVMHLWYAQVRTFTEAEKRLLTAIADMAGNALQRVRLFEETRRRLNELNTLHQASQTLLVSKLDPEATYTAIHRAIAQTMPCQALSIVLEDQALGDYHGVYLYDKSGRVPAQRVPRGKGLSGYVISTGKTLLIDDYAAQTEISALHFGDPEHVRSILAVPLRRGAQTIGMVATQAYPPHAFTQEHRVLLETLAAQFATSIENAHLYEQTRLRLRELEVVSTVSAALRTAPTQSEMFPVILDQLIHLLDVDGAAIEMLEPATGDLSTKLGRGVWAPLTGERIPAGKGLSAQVLATGEPYLNNNARNDPRLFRPDAFGDCRAAAGVPLRVKTQTIGLLWLASRRTLTEHDLRLLTAIADIAANAIHRAALNEQTERHLSQLATLHEIDRAISNSFDLRLTLNLLLEHVTTQLDVDAASVLLLNPQTQVLEYAASCGFRTRAIEQTRLRIGESFAGRAALERQSVHVPDLAARAEEFTVKGLVAEDYAEYYGVPLIARGNVVGVMEIFHRTPLPSDKEWFDFCAMLAGQAALAIDNARLFNDLQQANVELARAYDATIEGWSRALDLRDKETEGHTQRVTEMTLEIARALGIGEEEIVHIRRGALLHDIGKMGVSDNILLKPGKLTEAERAIMREHPRHAYELLLPIEYLRPALDIPYCHHEKWDGTGYPRGLKGEDIPLVARIFAVVDVYDALTSDRPYRKAWRREDVFEYIRQQAGKHFDPRVVEIFLKMFGT